MWALDLVEGSAPAVCRQPIVAKVSVPAVAGTAWVTLRCTVAKAYVEQDYWKKAKAKPADAVKTALAEDLEIQTYGGELRPSANGKGSRGTFGSRRLRQREFDLAREDGRGLFEAYKERLRNSRVLHRLGSGRKLRKVTASISDGWQRKQRWHRKPSH